MINPDKSFRATTETGKLQLARATIYSRNESKQEVHETRISRGSVETIFSNNEIITEKILQ